MMRPVKTALGLVVLIPLTACNMVTTSNPMFAKADGLYAPPIRLGVWRSDKPDCEFDETLPQDKWPKCAGAEPGVGDPPIWVEVSGDPDLLQLYFPVPYLKNASGSYMYAAFRPLKLDAQGRVVAMKSWPVQCGPPPPPTAPEPAAPASSATTPTSEAKAPPAELKEAAGRMVAGLALMSATRSPLPGLHMDNNFGACTPDSVASLRDAAKASEAWADNNSTSHWVRQFGPGDLPPLTQASFLNALPNGAPGPSERPGGATP
jgi:hypothetical protein